MKTKRMLIMPGILYAMSIYKWMNKISHLLECESKCRYFYSIAFLLHIFISFIVFTMKEHTFFGPIHTINDMYTEMHYNKL